MSNALKGLVAGLVATLVLTVLMILNSIYGLIPQVNFITLLTALGTLISQAERRAMEAERETIDRYVAAYLATRVGELIAARITG